MSAVDALAGRDPQLPVTALLDVDHLSEVLDAPTTIRRVRYKPGTSLVLAVQTPTGDAWVAAYADAEKLAKTRHRAHRSGTEIRDLGSGVATGSVAADRVLGPLLRRGRRALPADHTVLRYNPHRRLVVRAGDLAVKIAEADAAPLASQLADSGLAVLPTRTIARGMQATTWWGDGDLAARPDADAAHAAGAALAALHAAPWQVAGELPQTPTADAELATAVAAVARLDPQLGAQAATIAGGIRSLPSGVRRAAVHGDFTADQVLVGDGEVRLIDFDRAGLGEPERDLGSFAAGELLAGRGAALTHALSAAYGGDVDEAAVRRWTATAALQRAVEPFRTGHPEWLAAMRAALDVAERATAEVMA